MSSQASLFDLPAPPPAPQSEKARILEQHVARHRAYLDRLRAALRAEYERTSTPLSADDAARLRDADPTLRMPADMSRLALGPLFSGDKDENGRARWEMVGFVESTRDELHSHPIRTWKLRD